MAVQQIELRINGLLPIPHPHMRYPAVKLQSINAPVPKKTAAVFSEIIIHSGIKLFAVQPVPRRFPYFSD